MEENRNQLLRNQVLIGASTGAAVGIGLASANYLLAQYGKRQAKRRNPCKWRRKKRR